MKKLFFITLPLLLSGCSFAGTANESTQDSKPSVTSNDSQTNVHHTHNTSTGGNNTTNTGGNNTETGGNNTETGGNNNTGTGGNTTGGGTSQQTTGTVSKNMCDLGVENQKDVTTFDMASDLHVTCNKGGNTQNSPKFYISDQALRLYGKNTIKFESTNSISKIKFTISAETSNNELNCDTGTFSNNVWTGSAKSVTLIVNGSSGKYCIVSISVTYGGSGTTTGGGTETGGGTTGGGGGQTGGTDDGTNYISTWPENYQPFVTTYLNGMVPCFLNENKKNLFTGYKTGTFQQDDEEGNIYYIPYFNPYIYNTSPGINYEYNYGGILRDAGFKLIHEEVDEEKGATVHYYQKGNCFVQYDKHIGEDNKYYFDVYAFYDYYYTGSFKNAYNIQHDNKELSLTNKYDGNNKTVSVGNWSVTMNDVMKSSYSIQLKANSGSITIKGAIKGLLIGLDYNANAEALFVKAGTSSSNAKYVFNNGGYFEFPSGTTYAEISAKYRVLNIEYFDIIY